MIHQGKINWDVGYGVKLQSARQSCTFRNCTRFDMGTWRNGMCYYFLLANFQLVVLCLWLHMISYQSHDLEIQQSHCIAVQIKPSIGSYINFEEYEYCEAYVTNTRDNIAY